jgi:hypothetical protein
MNTHPTCPLTTLLSGAGNCAMVLALLTFAPCVSHGADSSPGVLSLNNPPRMPTNLTPVNASVGVSRTPLLSASPFSDPDGDGHGASQWQIATNAGFATAAIVWDTGTDVVNLTNAVPPLLEQELVYWWRTRYEDDYTEGPKWSEWSSGTWFRTEVPEPFALACFSAGVYLYLRGRNARDPV